MASTELATGNPRMDSSSTEEIAPVTFLFSWVPYPTTTTSSSEVMSSRKTISIMLLSPTGILWDSNPIKEKTKVDPSGTDRLYLPSRSVVVPNVASKTDMATPGIGSPAESFTVPLIMTSLFSNTPLAGPADRFRRVNWNSKQYRQHLLTLLDTCNDLFIVNDGFIVI